MELFKNMDYRLLLFTVIVLFVIYFLRNIIPWLYQVWISTKALNNFCPVKPHWFFGHLAVHPGLTEAGLMKNNEWVAKCPRFYSFFIGPLRPVLSLHHPETLKLLLQTAEPKNTTSGGAYKLLMPWIGDGLLISRGQKWARNRRLLTPGFHFDVLKPYIQIYNESAKQLARYFDNNSKNNKSVEIFYPVSLCTLSTILKCAFSYDEKIQVDDNKTQGGNPYVETVLALSKLIVDRAMNPLHHFDTLYYATESGKRFAKCCSFSHQKAADVIRNRRLAFKKGENPNKASRYIDFLDILLLAKDQDGSGLSDDEIRDEVETFMFEGHDTTASGISWALHNLAKHPEVQQKARQEIDDIMSGTGVDEIQWDDLSKLEYLTMCIKESFRLNPAVWIVSRELTKPLIVDGYTIPAGTDVDCNIWNVHHNPNVWGEDHMSYKPDRFLPENMAKMDPFAFIPFSAGPRNCIGQNFAMNEIKCVLAYILHHFEFSLDAAHVVEILPEIVLRSKNGIKINFKRICSEAK